MLHRPATTEAAAAEDRLVDEDSLEPVSMPGPAGPQPMRISQSVTVIPPPGAPNGTPGRGNILLEMSAGLPLRPGSYRWKATLGDRHEDDWSARFFIHAPPTAPTFGLTAAPDT